MDFYANLHMHSTHSDGGFTPEHLVKVAKKEGYQAMAITDHDTVTAYPELKAACDREGMDCIFGVEFYGRSKLLTGTYQKYGLYHILGFNFDPEYPEMKQYLRKMSKREENQTRILFERGVKEGKLENITWDEVLEHNPDVTWLCNDHVFRTLIAKGMAVPSDKPRFFAELFGPRRYEVPDLYPIKQEAEIIQLIHDAGGIALVAHPHKQLHTLDALVEMGLDGLEVWHPELTPEEQDAAYRYGLAHDLYISGGSDHYGLLGGAYDENTPKDKAIRYIPPRSVGTTLEFYTEIKNMQLNR